MMGDVVGRALPFVELLKDSSLDELLKLLIVGLELVLLPHPGLQPRAIAMACCASFHM